MEERIQPNLTTVEAAAQQESALDRFERVTAVPMLALALATIPLIIVPLATSLSPEAARTITWLEVMIWAAFAAEYAIRLCLSPKRWSFVKHNVLDLLVVALPFLRPLKVLRSARAMRLLRASRVVVLLARGGKAAKNVLSRHGLQYVLLVALCVIVGGGLLVEEAERNGGGHIHTVADGLWWAAMTVSTVGYGDMVPVTPLGKGIAILLMFVGIGLFSTLAASLASYFIEQRQEDTVDPQIEQVVARLQRIEDAVLALSAPRSEGSASGEEETDEAERYQASG
jgi:voltage-gated potassium channel